MTPEKVRELVEKILSASMQDLFRHQELWAEIDRKQIEMMRQYIAENQHRAVQVGEDIWTIPFKE